MSVSSPTWWLNFLHKIPVNSSFNLHISSHSDNSLYLERVLIISLFMYQPKICFALISPQHSSSFWSLKLNRTSWSLFFTWESVSKENTDAFSFLLWRLSIPIDFNCSIKRSFHILSLQRSLHNPSTQVEIDLHQVEWGNFHPYFLDTVLLKSTLSLPETLFPGGIILIF